MNISFIQRKSRGFTIVELLIVIVVIGILAAISIVTYNGVQQKGRDTAVLSDADAVAGELAHYAVTNNGVYGPDLLWYSPSGPNSNISFVASSGNIIDVATSTTDYCIRVYNPLSATYKTLAASYKKGSTSTACNGLSASLAAQGVSPIVNGGVVTTVAGSGTAGFTNATGTAATFNYPWGIRIDPLGNIFVADTVNAAIRKISTSGAVTTVAGSGNPSYTNGNGTAAEFSYIYGLTINSDGSMIVPDTGNNAIRKISVTGDVTTVFGPTSNGVNCQSSPLYLRSPEDIVQDASGNYYISDQNNNCIRKMTPSGVVTTFAGSGVAGTTDGTGTAASFNNPTGMAIDSAGNIYVSDSSSGRIRKITPAAVVTTLAGIGTGYVDGAGTSARFSAPTGLAVDGAGTVYVADRGNNKIRRITPAGVVDTLAGSTAGFAEGTGTAAKFNNPGGIAIDGNGVLYVADTNNHRIRKIQ